MHNRVCIPHTNNKDPGGVFEFRALGEESNYPLINQTSSKTLEFGVRRIKGCESNASKHIITNFKSAYQVSKNVLQYDQLQKKEIPPFSL
jgi:hypothetical protein